jgi:hypothetical protein
VKGAIVEHLGEVLRAARLSHNLTLDAIQARTKLRRQFFEDLERDDLSKWPSSPFYRESYLRAYADAVGLDPRDVVHRYRREHAPIDVENAVPPASRPRRLTPVTIPLILVVTFAIAFATGRLLGPTSEAQADTMNTPAAGVEAVSARHTDVVLPAEAPAVNVGDIEGELLITSTPSAAHVTVNGIGRGSTPVRVRFLPVGSYTVRFVRPGHPSVTRHVTISPERQQARVSAGFESARTTN